MSLQTSLKHSLSSRLEIFFKQRRSSTGWLALALAMGFLIWGYEMFWKFPQGLYHIEHNPRLGDFLDLCENPFQRNLQEPILAYRMTIPLFAWLLNLSPQFCASLGFLCLIAAYGVLWLALYRRSSATYATLLSLTLSQTFFGHWSNRWIGVPDSLTHLCAALALLTRNPILLAVLVVAGMMNDERFIFSVPLIIWWHIWDKKNDESAFQDETTSEAIRRNLFQHKEVIIGLLIGLGLTFALRYALTVGLIGPGIVKPDVYLQMQDQVKSGFSWRPYFSTWPLFAINVTLAWSWMWFYGFTFFRDTRKTWGLAVMLAWVAYLLAGLLASSLVVDVSRSVGFLFLFLLVGALSDYAASPEKASKHVWILLVLMTLIPSLYYTGPSGAVFIPYPIDQLNEWSRNHYGLDTFQMLKRFFAFHS